MPHNGPMINHTISSSWAKLAPSWPSFLVGRKLSDRKITQYVLAGKYGPATQKEFLARRKPAWKKDVNEGIFD